MQSDSSWNESVCLMKQNSVGLVPRQVRVSGLCPEWTHEATCQAVSDAWGHGVPASMVRIKVGGGRAKQWDHSATLREMGWDGATQLRATIVRSFSWIVEGHLAGARYPLFPQHIHSLLQEGIRTIVSVWEHPLNHTLTLSDDFRDALLAAQRDHGLQLVHIPCPDRGEPDPAHVQRAWKVAHRTWQRSLLHDTGAKPCGEPAGVLVHCTNGSKRTGIVLQAFLVLAGWDEASAWSHVKSLRPQTQVRLSHLAFLAKVQALDPEPDECLRAVHHVLKRYTGVRCANAVCAHCRRLWTHAKDQSESHNAVVPADE